MVTTRTYRIAGILAAALAAYALLGFRGVPWLVQRQAARIVQEQLGRPAAIGAVRFNPFTLRLEAEGLKLAEAKGEPIADIGRIDVQMQWRSLVTGAWRFDHILVTGPALRMAIAPDGRFNLAELARDLSRGRAPSKDDSLPRLAIDRLAVSGGRIDMDDRQAGYANTFTPIEFELAGFSTLAGAQETHTFTARSRSGARVRWGGDFSMNPIRANGELVVEDASLPELSVYLRSMTKASVAAGKLSVRLPYRIAYADGRLDAKLAGASLALRELAVAREAATDSFAALSQLDVAGIDADLVQRTVAIAEVRAGPGRLAVRRDAKGELDIAHLMRESTGAAAAKPPVEAALPDWSLAVKRVAFEGLALAAVDDTVNPPLALQVGAAQLALNLQAAQAGGQLALKVGDGGLVLSDVQIAQGTQPPVRIAKIGVEGVSLDLGARQAHAARFFAEGGRLEVVRDRHGAVNFESWMKPAASRPAASAPSGAAWAATVKTVEASNFSVAVADEASGIRLRLADARARLEGAGTDLRKPVKFTGGFALREGGQVAAQGSVVPATGAVQAQLKLANLALAPLQPLLAQHVRLHIATGSFSAQGQVSASSPASRGEPKLRYAGSFDIAQLALNEDDGERFLAWQAVAAPRLTLALGPDRLDVPELRIDGADAKLIIEEDRSFNAARLLVKQSAAAAGAPTADAKPAGESFPVRVRRVRVQGGKLDFTDLSLRPQFSAKIHDLAGVVNGLSSDAEARSQVELDGRVDEFGLARVRGEANLFAPSNNTDLNVVFRNVDMVAASPYSMKFAGYRIAEGKISLDLDYRIRANKLEGDNKIVIDKLTLGERVDSPDALKIPLQLAIAILTDSDGRIDLGLPVSGNLDDPQFSYGAVVWKAIGNVLTKIVTAPFRALGAMLGVGGERLEAITFDAGSSQLQPPEREKVKQIAQILAKRGGLKLSVPGHYSEAADGEALRVQAVRRDVMQKAGIAIAAGESPGPLDLGDRPVRRALRELYAQRFGEGELDKAMKAAETATPAAPGASQAAPLPVWQRVGKFVQGEPQVADATAFYTGLRTRLERERALPADALTQLGAARARAVVEALALAGADAASTSTASPALVQASGRSVPLALGLEAR